MRIVTCTFGALLGVLLLPHVAAAEVRALPSHASHGWSTPGTIELRLSPMGVYQGGQNGLQVVAPDNGSTQVSFGIQGSLGFLLTAMLEPGFTLNVGYGNDAANGGRTQVGFTPFFKFNFWSSAHVNPFIEPFAGFMLQTDPNASTTYFDGGLNTGVDLLVTHWGVRLWSGFEAVAGGNTHTFGIPVKWALVVYF
jgi:hypothetical protein